MARWVGAQDQVTSAKKHKSYPIYNVTPKIRQIQNLKYF